MSEIRAPLPTAVERTHPNQVSPSQSHRSTTNMQQSLTALRQGVDAVKVNICLTETEESWDVIAGSISTLTRLCSQGGCDFPAELVPVLRSFSQPLTSAMNSERTRLSGAAIDLVVAVASGLGGEFEPLLPIFFPTLLILCTRTNKVMVTRAKACITTIIQVTQLPSIIPYLRQSVKDKSSSLRVTVAEGTLTCMNCFNPPDLEKDARARDIETIIRATARDANADVRKASKKVFEAYKLLLPSRVDSFTTPLTPTIKKYLDIKTNLSIISSKPLLQHKPSTLKLTTASSIPAQSTSAGTDSHHPRTLSRPLSSSNLKQSGQVLRKHSSQSVRATPGVDVTMPPPQYIPKRPAKPPSVRAVSASRATSALEDQAKLVKPASATSGPTSRRDDEAKSSTQTRPVSASGFLNASRRTPLPSDSLAVSSQKPADSGPQRIPLPEREERGRTIRVLPLAQGRNPVPTLRSISQSSGTQSRPAKAAEQPKPVPKSLSRAASKTAGVASERAIKPRSVTQPTLSQLSRTKAPVERKVPVVSKPVWGRPALTKNHSSKSMATQPSHPKSTSSSGPAHLEDEDEGDRAPTPAQVPLPPSPPPVHRESPLLEDIQTSDSAPETCGIETPAADVAISEEPDARLDQAHLIMVPEELTTPPPMETFVGDPLDFASKTPISTLLSSIHRGFLFTPSSPLSPPQSYLSQAPHTYGGSLAPLPFHLHTGPSKPTDHEDEFTCTTEPASRDETRHILGNVEIN